MHIPTGREKRRFSALDALLLPFLAGVALYVLYRVRNGIHYSWNWSFLPQYFFRRNVETRRIEAGSLVLGLLTTIRLSLWSSVLALIIGTLAGIVRTRGNRAFRLLGRVYVELIRNIPPLVVVFIFYFFLGNQITQWLGLADAVSHAGPVAKRLLAVLFSDPKRIPEFVSAVVTLGIYEGAYVTEIVRAGITSVAKGQWEAGYALGLTGAQQYRFIILPQALRAILPSLAGQFISVIKDSAIVSVISIQELTFQGLELMAATYRTFEVWIAILLLYFLLTSACSVGARAIERRMSRYHR